MEYEDEPCMLSEYNGSQMTQHASYSVYLAALQIHQKLQKTL
jgi:hypothetical protein